VEVRSRRRGWGSTRRCVEISPHGSLSIHRSGRDGCGIQTTERRFGSIGWRQGRSNVLIATFHMKTTTTGVVRFLSGEERRDKRVPHHFADGLDMRESAVDPVVVEVPQTSHIKGFAPDSTGVEAVAEDNSRLCVGRELPVTRSTNRTGEKVDERTERDTQTLEFSASVSCGPRRNTVVFRDAVGHAEMARSE
jgi:hypothetical protein